MTLEEPEELGLPKRSWAKISQVRTLFTEQLRKKIGHVSQEVLDQLVEGLIEIVSG